MMIRILFLVIFIFSFFEPLPLFAKESFCAWMTRPENARVLAVHRAINIPLGVPRASLSEPFAWSYGFESAAVGYSLANGSTRSFFPDFRMAVIRERSNELGDRLFFEGSRFLKDQQPTTIAMEQGRRSAGALFEDIYQRYAQQGPERRTLVSRAKRQDVQEKRDGRITTFSLFSTRVDRFRELLAESGVHPDWNANALGVPIGQAQVLVSRNAIERLHVEEEIGTIARSEGEIIAEAGRLDFIQDIDLFGPIRDEKTFMGQSFWITSLFKTMVHWINNDTPIHRLYYQCNARVASKLAEWGIPVQAAKKYAFKKSYRSNSGDGAKEVEVEEYVFEFDQAALRQVEDSLMCKSLKSLLQLFTRDELGHYDFFQLSFTLNEINSLERMGLIQWVEDGQASSLNREMIDFSLVALPHQYPLYPKSDQLGFVFIDPNGFVRIGGAQDLKSGEIGANEPLFKLARSQKDHFRTLKLQFTREAAQALLGVL